MSAIGNSHLNLRILHVFKTYTPDSRGGIESVIQTLAEGMGALGVESEVLTLSPDPRPQTITVDGHRVHRAKRIANIASTGISTGIFPMFARLCREADVIHYHFPWPLMDLLHLGMAAGRPSVVTYHSDVVRQKTLLVFYRPLMRRFLAGVDRVVATSPNYLATSADLQPVRHKTETIPLGIPAAVSAPDEARIDRWKARVPERFFFFLGAPRYYKGLEYLFAAARKTGLPVVLAGGIPPGLKPPGADNIHIVGHVDEADKLALLALCDAFVFPSHLRAEAFGVVLVEAARAGRPMISCEIGTGTSYVNIDGETGLTVPGADVDALAAAMTRLWNDAGERADMGARARQRFERLFTAQAMCERYLALYRDVIAAHEARQGAPALVPMGTTGRHAR